MSMATKTIVCPECQAPATPGRYSCVRCGALLASIAMTPRAYEGRGPVQPMAELLPAADRPDHAVRGPLEPLPVAPLAVHAPDPIAPAWTQSLAAEQVDSEASPDERWDDELATADPVATAAAGPVVVEPIESDNLEPAHDAPPIPGWPPPGDLPMAPEPLARVPAGAYLPPSAVLPPGEALPIATEATGRAKAHDRRGWDSVGRPSAADRLSELGLPADTSRLVVSIGAAVAALAFLLPWTAAPAGDDVLADYVARWGLAGPGHWIVAAFLVALAAVAGMSGTDPESSPAGPDPRSDVAPGVARRADEPTSARLLGVGLPSIGLASLLLGLAWPYLFGFLGRAVGLWVVLAGLLLLVAGGLLALRTGRHRSPTPSV